MVWEPAVVSSGSFILPGGEFFRALDFSGRWTFPGVGLFRAVDSSRRWTLPGGGLFQAVDAIGAVDRSEDWLVRRQNDQIVDRLRVRDKDLYRSAIGKALAPSRCPRAWVEKAPDSALQV